MGFQELRFDFLYALGQPRANPRIKAQDPTMPPARLSRGRLNETRLQAKGPDNAGQVSDVDRSASH